ncbi:MAG: AtpZ/AtpI family protein [Halarsenatibacteraceae bacterium]
MMDKNDLGQIMKALGLLTYIGILMVVSIGIGYFLGAWLDTQFNTEPVIAIIGLIIGVGAGFYSVYQVVKELMD